MCRPKRDRAREDLGREGGGHGDHYIERRIAHTKQILSGTVAVFSVYFLLSVHRNMEYKNKSQQKWSCQSCYIIIFQNGNRLNSFEEHPIHVFVHIDVLYGKIEYTFVWTTEYGTQAMRWPFLFALLLRNWEKKNKLWLHVFQNVTHLFWHVWHQNENQ